LKNHKQDILNNGLVEAEDLNEISELNMNEFEFNGNDETENEGKNPIRFLEKVDFPHYGYLGENVLLD